MLSSQRSRPDSPLSPKQSSNLPRTLFLCAGSLLILAGLAAGYFSSFTDHATTTRTQPDSSAAAISPDTDPATTLNLPSLSSQTSTPSPLPPTPATQPAANPKSKIQDPKSEIPLQDSAQLSDSFVLPAADSNLSPVELADRFQQGMGLIEQNRLVQARALLSSLLVHSATRLAPRETQAIRDTLAAAANKLIFSGDVQHDDPLVEAYTVKPNDLLARIAPRYKIPYQLIEQINSADARRIRAGQTLKLIKGPFHAVVHKSEYRIDLFLSSPQGEPLYIRSFPVGLGEADSTPQGLWAVAAGGKVSNPGWTSPRTNKYYAPDDQANPIGEFWLGLEGLDDNTKGKKGYGIHGTIEPDSIGKQASLGCVRLKPDDIAQLYKLLVERHSLVRIEP